LMPPGKTSWQDMVRGEITFDNAEIDDSVLLKGDGFPTYHLAVVVDDHLMDITHILRAEEWVPSTPKHLNLYRALGWEPPQIGHVPLVLGEDRNKLSKRKGAFNVLEYREMGYLPAAVTNAMALVGWSSGTEDEVFTLQELAERFSMERVHPAGGLFDAKRLDALNGLHIRRLSAEEMAAEMTRWLPGSTAEQRAQLVPMVQERINRLDELPALCAPLLGEPVRADDVQFPPKKVDEETAWFLVDATIAAVRQGGLDDIEKLRLDLTAKLDERGVKARDGFRVLYIAILGRPVGVPVFDAMRFIGAEATISRLEALRERVS
jgi:glutamyl-tRNA synthetase